MTKILGVNVAYQKCMKVKTLNFNWLLFFGVSLFILGLILFSNALGPFNLADYQWCSFLSTLLLLINAFKCWFAKSWVFFLEVAYSFLYGVIAVFLGEPAYLGALVNIMIAVYGVLGFFRLTYYGRVEYACLKRRPLRPLPCISRVWQSILARSQRSGLSTIWHTTLFCGGVNLLLALLLAFTPVSLSMLLVANSIDLICMGLALFRLGLLL